MASELKVCDVDPKVKELLKTFRFSKSKLKRAITLRVDVGELLVVLDEEYEDISLDDLQEELPAHQPRYIVYSYCHKHDDGRISYPLIFIFVSPQGVKPELQMMYAGSKMQVTRVIELTKIFEVRSVEELTEEWLKEKLSFFR